MGNQALVMRTDASVFRVGEGGQRLPSTRLHFVAKCLGLVGSGHHQTPRPSPELAEEREDRLTRLVRLSQDGRTCLLQDVESCHLCGLSREVSIHDATT